MLERARIFYCLSLNLLSSTSDSVCPPPQIFCTVILNNLGEIYLELCQYEAMVEAYQDLKIVWTAGSGASAERTMEASDVHGLLLNMLLLTKPQVAAAA
jgi:hypothetical protein